MRDDCKPAHCVATRTFAAAHGGKGKWQLVADIFDVGWQ